MKGGALTKPGTVNLLSAYLLQDYAGLIHVASEGGQVERGELISEVIRQMLGYAV